MAELGALASANGAKLLWVGASVAVEAEVEKAVAECERALGGVDVLVNNAGITKDGLIFRMKAEDWKAVLDVNLTGAFYFSRACANKMIKQRSGSIINMGSIVGIIGNGGQTNYSASGGPVA